MLKNLITALTISFSLLYFSVNVNAENNINLRDNVRNIIIEGNTLPNFWFDIEMDKTELQIINKYITSKKIIYYNKSIENINSQYKFLILDKINGISKAIYIINNSTGKTIGYCLFENVTLPSQDYIISNMPDPELLNLNLIKNLTLNNSYLKNDIIQTDRVTIKFYEKLHTNNFIERYGIMTEISGDNISTEKLIMDSYYPVSLDTDIGSRLIKNINNKLDYLNRYWDGEELPIEFRY